MKDYQLKPHIANVIEDKHSKKTSLVKDYQLQPRIANVIEDKHSKKT